MSNWQLYAFALLFLSLVIVSLKQNIFSIAFVVCAAAFLSIFVFFVMCNRISLKGHNIQHSKQSKCTGSTCSIQAIYDTDNAEETYLWRNHIRLFVDILLKSIISHNSPLFKFSRVFELLKLIRIYMLPKHALYSFS